MWAQQKFKIFEKDADGHFQRVHYKPIVFVVLALVFVFLQPDSADLLLAHKQLQNKP